MGLRYNDALFQVGLVGFICFCCPGMFNVLNSLGGGGLEDKDVARLANTALYTFFSIFGVLGGGIVNIFGAKYSLAVSGLGYALYSGSFLIYKANPASNGWVVILCGGILGICAGILWAAQGSIMMAYASENSKGFYISVFWIIFNLGPVLGSVIPFGLNYNSTQSEVSSGTYIGLIVVMAVGCGIAFLLAPIEKVIRDDGKPVQFTPYENVVQESIEVFKVFSDVNMLLLVPLFVSSNWFYTYQFEFFNGVVFNLRTRAFNNIWYWALQMFGALAMGRFLDTPSLSRSRRGIYGVIGLAVIFTCTWAGGLAFQFNYSKELNPFKMIGVKGNEGLDFTDSSYGGPIVLYMLYGMLDAMLQTLAYWMMGSLSSDSLVLSRYAGFYKGIQSAGAAIAWALSSTEISYMSHLIICWVLLEASVPGALLVVRSISDHLEDDSNAPVSKQSLELA